MIGVISALRTARLKNRKRFIGRCLPRGDRAGMSAKKRSHARGFTLIELMTALVILALLGLMSYRGLSAVLDSREHVARETAKWRALAAFFNRLENDLQRAAPRPVRGASADSAALRGARSASGDSIELTRFGAHDGGEAPRRIAYTKNAAHEIELWLWPGLDAAPLSQPQRYPVLSGVTRLEFDYLGADLAWLDGWPSPGSARLLPAAVRVRVVLASGEELVRVFALA